VTLTLRLKTLNTPSNPSRTELVVLSNNYRFHDMVQAIDDALERADELTIRTASGEMRLMDTTTLRTLALRQER
jgi:hypothetical protein